MPARRARRHRHRRTAQAERGDRRRRGVPAVPRRHLLDSRRRRSERDRRDRRTRRTCSTCSASTPALGRGFARHEEGTGRPNTIVLTHELWTRFGADPAIVGYSRCGCRRKAATRSRRAAAGVHVRAQRRPRRAAAHRRLHPVLDRSGAIESRTRAAIPRSSAPAAAHRRKRWPPPSARSAAPSTPATSTGAA